MYPVDNAIIMAAGLSSRFAPLSYEKPKALIEVMGEIMIERQIRQLKEAGITEIIIVTGYKAEMFEYLKDKHGVKLIWNPEFMSKNNHASLWVAREYLKNTYICSADNYFAINPFEKSVAKSYYATVYAKGCTKEWCVFCDESERITRVQVGGENAWYMMGHAFFDREFSRKFSVYLEKEYNKPETASMFWEDIYIKYIDMLDMEIRKYELGDINEFDSLDELRDFDISYIQNARSAIIEHIAYRLSCMQEDIKHIYPLRKNNKVIGFEFICKGSNYHYTYESGRLEKVTNEHNG